MSEVPEQNGPLPVLSYANLRGEQPLDSRFVCEELADGVRLTEPALASVSRRKIIGGIWAVGLGSVVLMVAVLRIRIVIPEDWAPIIGACAVICVGVLLIIKGRVGQAWPLVIEVRGEQLTITHRNVSHWRWRRRWPVGEIKGITVSAGSISFPSGRIHSELKVFRGWRVWPVVLISRPRDECLWLAKILRAALELAGERGC